MDITKKIDSKKYGEYVTKKMPKSNLPLDIIKAFVVGGLICVIGEAFSTLYSDVCGLREDTVSALTSSTMIFLGALFTGLGVNDVLGNFAGAGSIVPITGFANSIVSPAMEFKREGLVLGVGAKLFSVAGPVLVYGITASVIASGILWLFGAI